MVSYSSFSLLVLSCTLLCSSVFGYSESRSGIRFTAVDSWLMNMEACSSMIGSSDSSELFSMVSKDEDESSMSNDDAS